MSLDQTQNFVRATIASAVDSADTTIDVTDSNQLPDPADGEYNLILWDVDTYPRPGQDPNVEVVRATALDESADELSVDRGQENTAAADHPETAVLQLSPTAKMFADIDSKTSALSEDGQSFAGESVDVEGLTIDDTYFWASEFDGADADSRLSNALTEVPEGSTIFLENAKYLSNRTIEKRLSLTGTGRVDGDGTTIAAEWTLDEIVSIHRVAELRDDNGTAKIIINRQRCEIHSVYGTDEIVVQADDAIITNIFRADITFEDGTSDGIVDSCTGSSIVDNGSNTVGDVA